MLFAIFKSSLQFKLIYRGINTSTYKPEFVHYRKQGYILLHDKLTSKEIESLHHSGSTLMKSFSEYTGEEIIPNRDSSSVAQDWEFFFSGGSKVDAKIKNIRLTDNVRGYIGEGINALGNHLNDDVEELRNFLKSVAIKEIVRDIFKLKAPIIAASLYISMLNKNWSNMRKDNSFIRTNPLSAQV